MEMPRGRKKKVERKAAEDKPVSSSELRKRLDAVCAAVTKACPSEWSGDDPIMTLKADKISRIPTFTTGSLLLDKSMGGGYAWGRIVEVYGPESSGKTTLTLHALAAVQEQNELCALIDSENSFDPMYAQKLNVNVENLLVSQPDSGEHALNIMMELVKNDVKLVVVDSVAALTPRDMFEAAIGTVTMGKHAKMMSEGLRNLNTLLAKKRSTVIFTNQIRTQIGTPNASMASGTTGGKALRFYASQRLELRRIGSDKSGEEIINNIVKAKVAKNKIAPPFRTCVFKIRFGSGIDKIEQIIDLGIDMEFIDKSGAWFTIEDVDDRLQGRQKLYDYLAERDALQDVLYEKILKNFEGDTKPVKQATPEVPGEENADPPKDESSESNEIMEAEGNVDVEEV
jgi:recombination protein RecA